MSSRSFSERFIRIEKIISQSQVIQEVREALEKYGYDGQKFKEGEELVKILHKAVDHHMDAYNMYHDAVANFNRLRNQAEHTHKNYVKLARIVFRNIDELIPPFQKNDRKKRKFAVWADETEFFYKIILKEPGWLDGFNKLFGIGKEKLEAGLNIVTEAVKANADKTDKFGTAQEATRLRDIAMQEAEKWCSTLIIVARLSLGKDSRHVKALSM